MQEVIADHPFLYYTKCNAGLLIILFQVSVIILFQKYVPLILIILIMKTCIKQ